MKGFFLVLFLTFSVLSINGLLPECDRLFLAETFNNSSRLVFKEYRPLFAELGWYKESHKYKTYTPGFCDEMVKHAALLAEVNRASTFFMQDHRIPDVNLVIDHLYSQMIYDVHQETKKKHFDVSVSIYIEPLMALLRDPYSIPCGKILTRAYPKAQDQATSETQVKRNVLLGPHAPKIIYVDSTPKCITIHPVPFDSWRKGRVLVFDLGATLFGTWGKHDVSASAGGWFYYNLKTAGVDISHYYAFEADPKSPLEIWHSIPLELRGKYTYINVPVSGDPNHQDYPWALMTQVAFPIDYVIVKVDIDTPDIENAIVDHLLENPKYLRLIDEFFYEHHVDIEPMHQWWGSGQNLYLADSYRIFTKFREGGVRSHAWP